jgi:Rrf2 family protein
MKLTTKARCALRAMIELALNPDARLSVKEIAKRQDLSVRYLEQVFSVLKREKFINSIKGPTGGYLLSRDARLISLADIVFAVEGRNQFDQKTEHDDLLNTELSNLWSKLDDQIEDYLSNISLYTIANDYKLKSNEQFMYYI